MTAVTKAANAHTVVATGWTSPANCYSTATDSAYATIATVRNTTLSGDFGFPAFTTSEVPDHSTLTSVVVFATYGMSAATTGALVGLQARRNSTGATLGSEITRSTASMADANTTATGATLADLRTANELCVRARGTKGNSSTASDARIDRLYVTVTFTEAVSAAAGSITGAATLAPAGRKGAAGAGGALSTAPVVAAAGRKAVGAAAGSAAGSPVLSLAGTRAEASEAHSGAGSMTLAADQAAAGTKAAAGTGSLTVVPTIAASGVRQEGAEAHSGTGSLVLAALLAASGLSSEAYVPQSGGRGPRFRPVPVEAHGGAGSLALRARLSGSGSKTFEADDELVLALAA